MNGRLPTLATSLLLVVLIAEGIIPAPEATHGIAQVIREAEQAKKEGVAKTILFNLCGHGFVDMQAYADYFEGKLSDHFFTGKN